MLLSGCSADEFLLRVKHMESKGTNDANTTWDILANMKSKAMSSG